jgi:hypothetical protein
MAKYSVVFDDNGVALKATDGKAKPFNDVFVTGVSLNDAMLTTKQEIQGRGELTRSMLSILIQVLQSSRIDGYRGKIALDSGLDASYKDLMRQAENDTLEPVFNAALDSKNTDDIDKPEYKISRTAQWSKYIQDLRAGGMYARAKATASLYMGYFGKLPCAYNADGTPDTMRLIGVTAMEKIIANAKTDLAKQENDGFSKRLVDLLTDMKAKTQKSHVGNVATALASLAELETLFRSIQKEDQDKALAAHQAKADAEAKVKNDADNKARAELLKAGEHTPAPAYVAPAKPSIDAQAKAITEKAIKATKHQRHAKLTHNDVPALV